VPLSMAASLNFIAQFPNGTQIGGTKEVNGSIITSPGMWLVLEPAGSTKPFTGAYTGSSSLPFTLFNDKKYTVEMTSYGDTRFSYWKDNNSTNPIRTIALKGNATYIAIYNDV